MFDLLFIVSIIGTIVQVVKEKCTPEIPIENMANRELYHKDIINNVSLEQRMENIKNGKYKSVEVYDEPHRDSKTGKIIIENYKLYYEDADKYGGWQAHRWAERGKYNLPSDKS